MEITKKRKAKIRDAILEKFRGNKTFEWNEMSTKEWYTEIDNNYYVVENEIKHLIGQDHLKNDNQQIGVKYFRQVNLTEKGWSILSDIKNEGYVAAYWKNIRKLIWTVAIGIITILTFLLMLRRDFIVNKDEPQDTSKESVVNSNSINKAAEITYSSNINHEIKTPELNLNKFIHLTESLFRRITGKSINLTYKIDTINKPIKINESYFSPLVLSQNAIIKRISIEPQNGFKELRVWIIDATFKDSAETKNVFTELRKISGKVNDSTDFSPGLSYSNDYVLESGNKIFWINSGCPVSFSNHQVLKHFLFQSLSDTIVQDSIHCKCGQPECKL